MSDYQTADDFTQPSWPFPKKVLPLEEVVPSPPSAPDRLDRMVLDGWVAVRAKRVYPLFELPTEPGYLFYDG